MALGTNGTCKILSIGSGEKVILVLEEKGESDKFLVASNKLLVAYVQYRVEKTNSKAGLYS